MSFAECLEVNARVLAAWSSLPYWLLLPMPLPSKAGNLGVIEIWRRVLCFLKEMNLC